MFIVKWWGDLDKDPLNYGLEEAKDYKEVQSLCSILANKGLSVQIFVATLYKEYINES